MATPYAGGNTTLTLPAANALAPNGIVQRYKRVDTDASFWCRVYPAGSDTIKVGSNAAAYFTVGIGETWTAVSDGANVWHAWKESA